jgi:hypothetical protein
VLNPPRAIPDRPTSRASITITSTAALSTSTTLFHFRDLPCHSVAQPRGAASRASITITSTAALSTSTSTTLFHFRDLPCHSVATPATTHFKNLRALRDFVLIPRAPSPLRLCAFARNPRAPSPRSIPICSPSVIGSQERLDETVQFEPRMDTELFP